MGVAFKQFFFEKVTKKYPSKYHYDRSLGKIKKLIYSYVNKGYWVRITSIEKFLPSLKPETLNRKGTNPYLHYLLKLDTQSNPELKNEIETLPEMFIKNENTHYIYFVKLSNKHIHIDTDNLSEQTFQTLYNQILKKTNIEPIDFNSENFKKTVENSYDECIWKDPIDYKITPGLKLDMTAKIAANSKSTNDIAIYRMINVGSVDYCNNVPADAWMPTQTYSFFPDSFVIEKMYPVKLFSFE
jgi:hypothetical protein